MSSHFLFIFKGKINIADDDSTTEKETKGTNRKDNTKIAKFTASHTIHNWRGTIKRKIVNIMQLRNT